jgi:hypothetical protein
MKHLWALLPSLLLVSILLVARPTVAHAATCTFVGGFKTLHDLIPTVVGNCTDTEYYDPTTGDGQQNTTGASGHGGLLVWSKADNLTSFTDGYHTWILGPYGLQERLNTQRFAWEPLAAGQSLNWAGYTATHGSFTGVSGSFNVPTPQPVARISGAASWVGIGGLSSTDLIQAGVDQTVTGSGLVQYSAWWETLPQAAQTIPVTIHGGDQVAVSLTQPSSDHWRIQLTDTTTGQSFDQTVTYASSLSSSEWIEEAPSTGRGLLPLADFGTVHFQNGSTIQNGATDTIARAGSTPLSMVAPNGQIEAAPSTLGSDGASFQITWDSISPTLPPVPQVEVLPFPFSPF